MNKIKSIVLSCMWFSLVTPVIASEDIRLVISYYTESSNSFLLEQTASQDICINTPDNNNHWCIETPVKTGSEQFKEVRKTSGELKSDVITLKSYGYSSSEIIKSLLATNKFVSVEIDYEIKQSLSYTNDPNITYYMDNYFSSINESFVGSNVYSANELVGNPEGDKVDVLVFDGSFFDTDDVPYLNDAGRSFVTLEGETPNDNYAPTSSDGCNGHGLSVASIIGATIDNNKGADGVTNAVNIHPIRVMKCGAGNLSDIGRALSWIRGETFSLFEEPEYDITPYSGNVGIINISISGFTGDNEVDEYSGCPLYLQDEIDQVLALGWVIVTSAGNYSSNANHYTPGNCEGVINVAALGSNGDAVDFSNLGSSVSVSANGTNFAASCNENDDMFCLFSGTSSSAPLVTGILAMAKQYSGIDSHTLKSLMKTTARKDYYGQNCNENNGCGAGLIDAKALIETSAKSIDGELNTITFALNNGDDCSNSWIKDYFGASVRLCTLYQVSLMGGYTQDSATYRLFSVGNEDDLRDDTQQTLIGEFSSSDFMLADLPIEGRTYGFQICESGSCGEVLEINSSKAEESERPASCNI